jgi:hypothetical protein
MMFDTTCLDKTMSVSGFDHHLDNAEMKAAHSNAPIGE